ncbi:1-deoxy-D-xylulose-5-phosphate synthase [Allobranchiibius sp. GilTou38]|uniref:1-deoxy-D-xylulose-5-phosphate synthase n=1 Tax=Allobranchiibius sp. GilTou38 TaxID=2815210 RepID=UPI001AA162C3|nr:1-deoxy-D-xylulose-5-phosphate synthase [Allobranchiibius sp. GilTou38]MBO1768501.1 1-deoxy-D-xylulose-5-phosphate synthase [Allobranchiibius sp. GilTou38]
MPARGSGLLDRVISPADVRALDARSLPALAAEVRERLVDVVTRTGGHLGPNLGVVEVTIALHRAFDSPREPIVWDTGHQAYVHKMLTGRAADLESLRVADGLSGYPSRRESEHDIVENSHASTSLSYADGLAKAHELTGCRRWVVAVIGDGAMTGGMAWEALNNIGGSGRNVLVVLNDNGRSYEPTVGALARHLAALRDGSAGSNLFETLGLRYIGPVDGHDLTALERSLRAVRRRPGPTVLHVVTRKGAGYDAAEQDEADCLHTVSPAPPPALTATVRPHGTRWTDAFATELVAIGEDRADVVAVIAAMRRPTGLLPFGTRFPHRTFDVGIAEQHAVTSAAGLATAGLHPVVAIYSTFLNRAFDQVLMDVALHRLPVTFVLDRAGITGPDGASHHGIWDVSMLGLVPGIRVAAPRDALRLRDLLREAVAEDGGPSAVRFPKGEAPAPVGAICRFGPVDVLRRRAGDGDVLLVSTGPLAAVALDAADRLGATGVAVTVVDPRWVHPLAPELVTMAAEHRLVVTLEDNAVPAGPGSALRDRLQQMGCSTKVLTVGHEARFIGVGEREDLLRERGIDVAYVVRLVQSSCWPGLRSDAVRLRALQA